MWRRLLEQDLKTRETEFTSVHPPSTLLCVYECVCLNTYTLQVLSPFRGVSWNSFVQQLALRTDCLSWCWMTSVQAHQNRCFNGTDNTVSSEKERSLRILSDVEWSGSCLFHGIYLNRTKNLRLFFSLPFFRPLRDIAAVTSRFDFLKLTVLNTALCYRHVTRL
jgi:hypothetical protein